MGRVVSGSLVITRRQTAEPLAFREPIFVASFTDVVPQVYELEFTKLLEKIHQAYSPETRILIVLDNHSAHISKETQAYLKTRPNRFEFVFTPKHGSWLNLVEVFFAKMAKTILRGIRVASKAELKARIMSYLRDLNTDPVVFRWHYKLEEETVS